MKFFPLLRSFGLFLILLVFPSLAGLILAEDSLKVRVRKGDTLSYLSFKTYGMFDPQIAEILKKENPQIKDIDLIYAGQQLIFPAPEEMERRLAESRPPQLPALPPPQVSETQVRAQKGVITFLEGQVEVKKSGEGQWSPARANMILTENDLIRVRSQSRAELILDNQSVLRLSENTMLTLQKMEEEKAAKKENTRMEMSMGRLWVRVSKLFNPASRHDVKTPTAIAGVQGTTYQLWVAGNQSTTVQVFDGAVNVYNPFPKVTPLPGAPSQVEKPREITGPQEVRGPSPVSREEWTQIVLHQYQQITVTGRETPQPTAFNPGRERQSDWVRWNEERDTDFKPPARPF
jgi:phage tail protein X